LNVLFPAYEAIVALFHYSPQCNYTFISTKVKLAIREGLEPPFATPITIREVEAPLGYRT